MKDFDPQGEECVDVKPPSSYGNPTCLAQAVNTNYCAARREGKLLSLTGTHRIAQYPLELPLQEELSAGLALEFEVDGITLMVDHLVENVR